MRLNTGINILKTKDIEKSLSKKILLANTADKHNAGKLGVASPADPIYFRNGSRQSLINPDIRYRNNYGYSPLTDINARNALLLFGENKEIKKALKAITNEIVVSELKSYKYPVFPQINLTTVSEDKQEVAANIQTYLDEVFYPKIFQKLKLKGKGLSKLIDEYLKTGKLAYEIVYDNLNRPKEIVNMVPIDPSTLQKYKDGDNLWYVQRPIDGNMKERILHENQVVLIEWNEYDFGYISYIDELRRSFNIMRGMQSSKILWFAAKSQVRMHIKLNMGDVPRTDAIQKLTEARDEFVNDFYFNKESGELLFNGEPDTVGYHEFFTAETTASGSPDIEEINSAGPDLTEVDSLQFWEKLFWKDTDIPYDRIDPSSSETWGFLDANSIKKTELNFGNFCLDIKDSISAILLKPIIIQLTLKEVEIGVDLALLDSILINWVSFNEYSKLAELEVIDKKVQIAKNIVDFSEVEDVNGVSRKMIPTLFVMDNYLDFTAEQKTAMEVARRKENIMLGFNPDGTTKEDETGEEEIVDEEVEENFDEFTDDENPADTDDANF